jgi:hypothetical protein
MLYFSNTAVEEKTKVNKEMNNVNNLYASTLTASKSNKEDNFKLRKVLCG